MKCSQPTQAETPTSSAFAGPAVDSAIWWRPDGPWDGGPYPPNGPPGRQAQHPISPARPDDISA
jgi:hypothetical protein